MRTIPQLDMLAKLPVAELDQALTTFLAPFLALLPDRRLYRPVALATQGMLTNRTPVVTHLAQATDRTDSTVWAAAKAVYRLLDNPRLSAWGFTKGLYRRAQATVAAEAPPYLVVALDPVQFEKPYTTQLEGVSTVHKATPPTRFGRARLARGYPALTATIVNTRVPATTYARWFSYRVDFVSQSRELRHAMRMTRFLFPTQRVRFVGDATFDDDALLYEFSQVQGEFVVRASHLERHVEVYNARLGRWEAETLGELVACGPVDARWRVAFRHAGTVRLSEVTIGWLPLRLPTTGQEVWALIAEDAKLGRLVLLTNIPITDETTAQQVYNDWRLRGRIEHGYRFAQEPGLDVEDMRVRTLDRQGRLFVLVLLAAEFVFYVEQTWPPAAVCWLRRLGGRLDVALDRDGPYIVLRGLGAVWQAVTTLTYLVGQPFPHELFTDLPTQAGPAVLPRCG